jgi:hypothetical protein
MKVKEFERFLELKKEQKDDCELFFKNEEKIREFGCLKAELENLLFDNQTNLEKMITKLKNSLSEQKCNLKRNASDSLNEIKVIREIMNLLDLYDWKLKYSEYNTSEGKQVAIWEQNGDGQIRNHKVWNVEDSMMNHMHYYSGLSEDMINDAVNKVVKRIVSETYKDGTHIHM